MSSTDHWFRFNIGDYIADTTELTCAQHGIYIQLLLYAYKHDGCIPADERMLARLVKLPRVTWRQEAPAVLAKFTFDGCGAEGGGMPLGASRGVRPDASGVYFHKRVLQELEHAKNISSMGKHAASHRWPKENGDADRTAHRTPDRYANQELEPEPSTPPRSPPSRGGDARRGHSRNAAVDIIREEMEARAREH